MHRIYLASGSPRRRELLNQVGIKAEVVYREIKEDIFSDLPASEMVQKLAAAKIQAVAELIPEGLIIGADTVVVSRGRILGKPQNEMQAREMLEFLSGQTHTVITGIAVLETPAQILFSDHEETRVKFKSLTPEEISGYIKTGEPFDKAAGYGIQGMGALLVERLEGDYFNVVGLPLQKLNQLLGNWKYNLLSAAINE